MASKVVSNDYSYINFQKDTARKTYNTVDTIEQLLWIETSKNTFRGYKQDLLVNSLTEIEVEFYVCTECHGVMRNACQLGNEQTPACELCVGEGVPSQMMMKSRKRILELRAICPMETRGCTWNGFISEIECHLNLCEEFVVQCNNCVVKLKRREVDNHNLNECLKRNVNCTHCQAVIIFKDLNQHYGVCDEYLIVCSNNCKTTIRRKQLNSHIDTNCPNKIVECPYRKFGCMKEVKRCELERHTVTNQIQHLESKTSFAISRMEQMEERIIAFTKIVERWSYHVILRNVIRHNFLQFKQEPTMNKHIHWYDSITFTTVSVTIIMDYDQHRSPLAKWPFEGRFKLTLLDNKNKDKSLVYESDIVKLQPENKTDRKGIYEDKVPSKLVLARISRKLLLEKRFRTDKGIQFTLQIQEAEDILITDSMKAI
ncbi:TNF receptor-associated factor 4 [Oopsacas minuta]|uniref:TNF receptor-associated factor 4 n=1 Tax=Oopsacas minuta TaxID=111878 RepID=A0AAV7JEK1_9METZ|nr:TNF receptor-associated factor 4 [Oopsacas minuta]